MRSLRTHHDSLTLVAGNDYSQRTGFIGDGEGETVLTIEAGITIYGPKDPGSPGTLIITHGSRIEANGTAAHLSCSPPINSKAKRLVVTGAG